LYNVTVCHAALGDPGAGVPAAQQAMGVAATLVNPTAQSMARCALGRALTELDPERAMSLFEEAGKLAVSVKNNWLRGIACAEDAAIRALHGDPPRRRACSSSWLSTGSSVDLGSGHSNGTPCATCPGC
jgi:hypothetical protein